MFRITNDFFNTLPKRQPRGASVVSLIIITALKDIITQFVGQRPVSLAGAKFENPSWGVQPRDEGQFNSSVL